MLVQKTYSYKNCNIFRAYPNGYYDTYVSVSHKDGRFFRANTLSGIKSLITDELSAHNLKRARAY